MEFELQNHFNNTCTPSLQILKCLLILMFAFVDYFRVDMASSSNFGVNDDLLDFFDDVRSSDSDEYYADNDADSNDEFVVEEIPIRDR